MKKQNFGPAEGVQKVKEDGSKIYAILEDIPKETDQT
jgi:hypothetical protein